jgi:hypothetical protein
MKSLGVGKGACPRFIGVLFKQRGSTRFPDCAMFSCVISLCLCASVAKNKKSRAKQRGTSLLLKFSGLVLSGLPELFSGFFYVAASRLNSPRFPFVLIRSRKQNCQARPRGSAGIGSVWNEQVRALTEPSAVAPDVSVNASLNTMAAPQSSDQVMKQYSRNARSVLYIARIRIHLEN